MKRCLRINPFPIIFACEVVFPSLPRTFLQCFGALRNYRTHRTHDKSPLKLVFRQNFIFLNTVTFDAKRLYEAAIRYQIPNLTSDIQMNDEHAQ